MAFIVTTAIRKMLAMTKRKKVVQGSTSAGKTYGIIPILIDRATKTPNTKILIIAETLPAVKAGALDIFKILMEELGRWHEDRFNASDLIYRFGNGSTMKFKAFDTAGKAKAEGKHHILFINEANHVDFKIADALMIRTTGEIWIDFNPDQPFWAHDEVLKEEDSEFLLITYKDNEGVSENTIKDLESKMRKAFYDPDGDWTDKRNIIDEYWANWCRVYVRGEIGNLEGTIYQNWAVCPSIPIGATFLGYGTDFGKGGDDPTVTLAIWYYDGAHYLDQVVYEAQLRDSDHARQILDHGLDVKRVPNWCDDSEPTKIRELVLRGVKGSEGAKKYTIDYGIGVIQEYGRFYITQRSSQVINDFRKYKYKEKNGLPDDKDNHAPDAFRYFMTSKYGADRKVPVKLRGKAHNTRSKRRR